VHPLPSPEDLHLRLKCILWDGGFRDDDLVQVASASVGGPARYVVTVLNDKVRCALADALERIIHRPLMGIYWIFCLEEVQAITTAAVARTL
jgi:hypothetical protein